jgi:hypothetical protein
MKKIESKARGKYRPRLTPNKKRHSIRLYPQQESLIKANGESVQEFVDRCVKELEQQLTSENI